MKPWRQRGQDTKGKWRRENVFLYLYLPMWKIILCFRQASSLCRIGEIYLKISNLFMNNRHKNYCIHCWRQWRWKDYLNRVCSGTFIHVNTAVRRCAGNMGVQRLWEAEPRIEKRPDRQSCWWNCSCQGYRRLCKTSSRHPINTHTLITQKNAEQRYLYGNGVTMRVRNS